jgi:hypothetical protein
MIHVEHLFTPSLFPDEFFRSGKCGFPAPDFRPHLVGRIYANPGFAKMIALPNKLTETPDRPFKWTFSTTS